jgi:HSP20 family molecular chaperone IbpA
MELVFENGWNVNSGLFDRLNSFRRDIDEAARGHTAPRAEVIEDKDAYHFYFEMPGLKGESLEVVENDQLTVATERKRPEWPRETEVYIAERGCGHIRRAFRLPLNASRDGIRATYTDDVLELTVDKRPSPSRSRSRSRSTRLSSKAAPRVASNFAALRRRGAPDWTSPATERLRESPSEASAYLARYFALAVFAIAAEIK